MKIGLAEIASAESYGMPEAHMMALQETARETNTSIGIRPVSRFAKTFLQEGCPTKSFAIKNKSANLGIAAGLIPISAKHGRVIADDKKHGKMLENAYHADPSLQEVALHLKAERIGELKHFFGDKLSVEAMPEPHDGAYVLEWMRGDETIKAYAMPDADGLGFNILDADLNPLLVLGKKINEHEVKPITADYDLLVVCPSYQAVDFQRDDKSPFRTQGSETKSIDAVMASTRDDYEGPKESPSMGNISPRTASLTQVINRNIAKIDSNRTELGLEVVHHNAEFANPFADDLRNNVPSLLVLPRPFDLSSLSGLAGRAADTDLTAVTSVLIETAEEMSLMRDCLRDAGYYWPAHAKYTKDLPAFRGEAVDATRKVIESMRHELSELRASTPSTSSSVSASPESRGVDSEDTDEEDGKRSSPDML
jgi:hypothetical protein